MKKTILLLILLVTIVSVVAWQILSKKSVPQTQPIAFQEICSSESSLFSSTGFLNKNQTVNIVGKYNSKTNELTNYDPYPCLEWQGEQQCRIIFWQDEKQVVGGKENTTLSMKSTSCPNNVLKEFPNPGNYKVRKTCCLNSGDCSLLEGNYQMTEECSVVVEAPKQEKACYLTPISLDKPLSGVGDNEYVYIQGHLSPFFRTQPVDFKEQQKQHFVAIVDSYRSIKPFSINSDQAITVCKNYLTQNRDFINKYCSDNGFSCNINQAIKEIEKTQAERLIKFSADQKWTVGLPVATKEIIKQDRQLKLNLVCQVDPYSENIVESTLCSQQSCIICEP
ncbi:MAG: hypothetical protein Q8R36_01455 [bacterium]|nr:hypothetical protein [bacterium]